MALVVFVMLTSVVAGETTAGEVDAALPGLGSLVVDVIVAVLLIVPVVAGRTCRTKVNVADVPLVSDAIVHVMVPVPSTGGYVQLNAGPVFCVPEAKVVPAGTVSES